MRNVELILTVIILYAAITTVLTMAMRPEEADQTIPLERTERSGDARTMFEDLMQTFFDLIAFSSQFASPFINLLIGMPFWIIIIYVVADEVRGFIPFVRGGD